MIRRKSTGVKMKDAISKKEWLVLCVYTNVMLCCMEYYIEGGREGDCRTQNINGLVLQMIGWLVINRGVKA